MWLQSLIHSTAIRKGCMLCAFEQAEDAIFCPLSRSRLAAFSDDDPVYRESPEFQEGLNRLQVKSYGRKTKLDNKGRDGVARKFYRY